MKHVTKPGLYWATFTQIGKDAVRVIVQVSGEPPLLQIDWGIHVAAKQPLIYYLPNRLDLNFGKRLKLRRSIDPLFPHSLNVDQAGLYLATWSRKRKAAGKPVLVQVSDEAPMLQVDWAVVIGDRSPTVLKPTAAELAFYKRLKIPELDRV